MKNLSDRRAEIWSRTCGLSLSSRTPRLNRPDTKVKYCPSLHLGFLQNILLPKNYTGSKERASKVCYAHSWAKRGKKSLKKLKMNRALSPALSPQFRATLGFPELPPDYRATMHSEEFIVLGDKVSRKLPCPSRVYFGTFNSHSAWVERWLQKEADPNSKLSSAHKRTIEAAFLLLTLLRELSKGAFFSIFCSLMSKGLAEKERKNKEQMVKEPCIWSSGKKIQRKICFYNTTLGWVKTTYHSSNSPDCCRQRI